MSLAWVTHTSPEICCSVAQVAHVNGQLFDPSHVKQLNGTILFLKSNPGRGICHHKLDQNTLRLKVYTDSSFANNPDCSSQLVHIVVFTDATDRCKVLQSLP